MAALSSFVYNLRDNVYRNVASDANDTTFPGFNGEETPVVFTRKVSLSSKSSSKKKDDMRVFAVASECLLADRATELKKRDKVIRLGRLYRHS